MDVWIAMNRRASRCNYCKEMIGPNEPAVKGKLWKNKRWPKSFRWHPQCWITQGVERLESHQVDLVPLGRPKMILSEEDRKARLRLLRRHATYRHLQKKAALDGDVVRVLGLEIKRQELFKEIESYGGAPGKWGTSDTTGSDGSGESGIQEAVQ